MATLENLRENHLIKSISPSVDQFAEVISEVPSWYNLGVYLGTPMAELDAISRAHSDGTHEGTQRCLMELYRRFERKGKSLSWEAIASTLKRMGNHGLADKIHTIIKEQLALIQPHPLTTDTQPEAIEYLEVPSTLASEYKMLSKKFIILLTNVKSAFINTTPLNISKMQDLIKRECGLPRLPQEVATIDTVFDRVEEECSILNFSLLELLIEELLSSNTTSKLAQYLEEFKLCIGYFKSSANMVELATLTKSKQTTPTGGQKTVTLKVREFWKRFTMEQFERIVNMIFKALYNIMRHITVTEGCISLNWIIPDIDTTELLPKLPLELVKLIGVIYLHIGSDVIYNVEGEGCESIKAAMIQAIELKNTRVIELLLAVGCNPEVATYNGDNTVTNIVNIRSIESKESSSSGSSHSVDHVCILGHNKHVEAIVDPASGAGSEPEECSSCIMKEKMVKHLHQENNVLQQKQNNLYLTIKNKESALNKLQLLRAEEKAKLLAGDQSTFEADTSTYPYQQFDDFCQEFDTLQLEKKALNKEKETRAEALAIKTKDSELDELQLLKSEENGKLIAGDHSTEAGTSTYQHQQCNDLHKKVDTLQLEKKVLNTEIETGVEALKTKNGFFPNTPPCERLPQQFDAWEALIDNLPALLKNKELRKEVDQSLPLIIVSDHSLPAEQHWNRAMKVLTFLSHGYIWQDGEEGAVSTLPRQLAIPWWEVSQRLGLPTVATYAAVVLWNWKVKDCTAPVSLDNIKIDMTYTGSKDEEWFYLIHAAIELSAAVGVHAASKCLEEAHKGNIPEVVKHLDDVAACISDMIDILQKMYQQCDPDIFYGRIRHFQAGSKNLKAFANGLLLQGVSSEPVKFFGASAAQSSILPVFDILLGVEHRDPTVKAFLENQRWHMPRLHRQFLFSLSLQEPLRAMVLSNTASTALLQAYNKCIQALAEFRNKHIILISSYIITPAVKVSDRSEQSEATLANRGTGGRELMKFLKKSRDETLDILIK